MRHLQRPLVPLRFLLIFVKTLFLNLGDDDEDEDCDVFGSSNTTGQGNGGSDGMKGVPAKMGPSDDRGSRGNTSLDARTNELWEQARLEKRQREERERQRQVTWAG